MFSKWRLWLEITAAAASALACIATLAEPQWFELLFDEAPDGGDGSLEAAIAIALSLLAFTVFSRRALREWRRLATME